MRKWEDIVKDKLEGYESALPEGSLGAWRARRAGGAAPSGAGAGAPARRGAPWAWVAAAAVAAGLAAVLFLRPPGTPAAGVRVEPQPVAPVALADEATAARASAGDAAAGQTAPAVDAPATAIVADSGDAAALGVDETGVGDGAEVADTGADETGVGDGADVADTGDNVETAVDDIAADEPAQGGTPASPYVPQRAGRGPVRVKVVPVAGAVAGGGLLAALGTSLLGAGTAMEAMPSPHGDGSYAGSEPPKDELLGSPVHHFPLRVGLSARIPLAERLSVTTGLEYSRYRSTFDYSLSGEKVQVAQYLGVPVRLDWTIASGKRVDVYAGAGLQGDVCVGATLARKRISPDSPSLSLLGAAGIQLNVSKRLGLYLEPQLSWQMLPGQPALATYRSAHPLMFSATTGLRVNL